MSFIPSARQVDLISFCDIEKVEFGMADQLLSNYTEDERQKLFHHKHLIKFKHPS